MTDGSRTLDALLQEYSEVRYRIAAGVNDSLDALDQKPLHVAAIRGSVIDLELLIANGADLNACGEHGYTPLHEAALQGHLAAVRCLLTHGANATLLNDDGCTPAGCTEDEAIVSLIRSSKPPVEP